MRLTIIKPDNSVYVNLVPCLHLDLSSVPANVHALQWFDMNGWVEFNDGTPNLEITELPLWANTCIQKWEDADYIRKNPTPVPPTVEVNKITALELLQQTDWATLPDVSDSLKSSPYLTNVEEFITYRNLIRQLVVNPEAGDINWPTTPQASWQL